MEETKPETAARGRRANDLGPTGERLAENLKRLRESAPMTTQQLAERVTELGRPMRANTITKIEKGQRRVDVDDLVALSIGLDTRPDALLLPPTVDGELQLTEAMTVPADEAWVWADGHRPLGLPDDDDGTLHNQFQMRARPPRMRSFRMTVQLTDEERAQFRAAQKKGDADG